MAVRPVDKLAEPRHYSDLGAVEEAAWALMVRGVNDRRSAFHQATVATCENGVPSARTVVLRGVDPRARTIRFHTDIRSEKISALRAGKACGVLFYDHGAKVQVRIDGKATVHHRDTATDDIWGGMREMSKACYRQTKAPGATLSDPREAEGDPLDDAGGYGNFVVVSVAVEAFEWLYLAAAGHRRARIDYANGEPARVWLAP